MKCSEQCGLTLNVKKTKLMILKQRQDNQTLMVHGIIIESKYIYFGTRVTSNNAYINEIKVRIEKARSTFIKMKKVPSARDLKLKMCIVKC